MQCEELFCLLEEDWTCCSVLAIGYDDLSIFFAKGHHGGDKNWQYFHIIGQIGSQHDVELGVEGIASTPQKLVYFGRLLPQAIIEGSVGRYIELYEG